MGAGGGQGGSQGCVRATRAAHVVCPCGTPFQIKDGIFLVYIFLIISLCKFCMMFFKQRIFIYTFHILICLRTCVNNLIVLK